MKAITVLLIPSVALLMSACAPVPEHRGYGGPGYYGHSDTVYMEGRDNDHRDVNRTNVNDRTISRTNVNERTVNRTNVNQVDVKNGAQGKGKRTTKEKTTRKPVETNVNNQQGDQQQPPRP